MRQVYNTDWNDSLPDDDRQQLKQYIPLLLETRGNNELESKRAWMATDWLVREQAPAWLELAGLTKQAAILRGMSEVTAASIPSIKPALEAARNDAAAAWAAAGDAAWAAAKKKLAPTVTKLQASAQGLVMRMIKATSWAEKV